MTLTAAQALRLLAQASMRKFTAADRETFVEYTQRTARS